METQTISVRLPKEKVEALDKIAASKADSRNQLLNNAIDSLIEMHETWDAGMEEALKDMEEGRLVDGKLAFQQIREKYWPTS
jgi:predicted transcriptional regulator